MACKRNPKLRKEIQHLFLPIVNEECLPSTLFSVILVLLVPVYDNMDADGTSSASKHTHTNLAYKTTRYNIKMRV